ncbi:DUF6325 family protein [Streptomyces sp. NPDC101181]|uniref:SHOCT domain-containing protein n=1 Tax=Streptomyces sp. NPDC101181 TaxID=3366125 RepID=UPI0038102956
MAVGPVEYLVIAFPGSRFPGAVAPALAEAAASGSLRPADLAFVRRAEDGSLVPAELRELDPAEALPLDADGGGAAPELIPEDLQALGDSVPGGDFAALVVREDLWSTPVARAVRAAGGAFVAHERLGADGTDAEEAVGDDIIDRLEHLAELWKREVLSDDEFVQQKAKLLSD